VAPSYLSANLVDPTASRRRLHERRSKSAAFSAFHGHGCSQAGAVATKTVFCRGVPSRRIW
jgi:hypothetical protein